MIAAAVSGLASLTAQAQPATTPAAAPAAVAPAEGAAVEVIVLEVKGTVQASTDDGKTWVPAKAGLHLSQGASFRTGFHSSVTCGIPPDQGFTLESLGTVRVEEAIKKGKRFKTDLVMKYGATNYSVETGGAEHETTIRTPGSTLSVRGTIVRVTDRPGFAPSAESITGRAVYKSRKGTTTVGAKGGRYSRVSAADGDAAQTALSQTVVDPANILARTATDAQLIAQQASLGAVISFNTRANIPVVQNSTPLSDSELIKSLPGTLDFVLRWTGNANLDLEVDDEAVNAKDEALGAGVVKYLKGGATQGLTPVQLGQIGITFNPPLPAPQTAPGYQPQEILFPGYGLNVSPSGGAIPYDNIGGPKGGMEIAYWPGASPQGLYFASVIHVSGGPANYQVNAYQNGQPLNLIYLNSSFTGVDRSTNQIGTLSSQNSGPTNAEVYAPSNSYYDGTSAFTTVNAPSLFSGTTTSAAVQANKRSKAAKDLGSAPALTVSPAVPMPARTR